ncbi:MAG: hypothetical protein NC115_03795 [Bacteroidales bacterium]|nr:hypothetical protein [Bacteroidales bacterium]
MAPFVGTGACNDAVFLHPFEVLGDGLLFMPGLSAIDEDVITGFSSIRDNIILRVFCLPYLCLPVLYLYSALPWHSPWGR